MFHLTRPSRVASDKNIEQLLEDETEDISKYSDYCNDESFEFSV